MSPVSQVVVWNVGILGEKRLLEGEVGWGAVREAWESPGCLSHAARHVQVVGVAHGGGDRQVGELGVEVPQISGTRLKRNKDKTHICYSRCTLNMLSIFFNQMHGNKTWIVQAKLSLAYHRGNKRRRDLPGHQVVPVDGREEAVVLEFQLKRAI